MNTLEFTANSIFVYVWTSHDKKLNTSYIKYVSNLALADVAQWIELQPANQKVAGSIPSQGTYLGFGPGPQ